jgi:predicted nicotinamide N-methyase
LTDRVVVESRELDELEASLERRFRMTKSRVEVGARTFVIRHPVSADELISQEDFDRDERLPYWADIWPSACVLAARVLDERGDGRSLIELGCGAGLVSAAAAVAGFDVTASDYYDDALRFARVNAYRNSGRNVATLSLDWRELPSDSTRYDCVVASDVLYERSYGPLVANAIAHFMAPGGVALVADPGRVSRDDFVRSLAPLGLGVSNRDEVSYEDGSIRQRIAVVRIERIPERK